MLTKQKEKAEISQSLKEEKAKLKTLNEFLDKCNYISSKTKENSAKSQNFLRRFGDELDPILKKSYELKNNVALIDQALGNARSKYEYLQNARVLERRLSQRVQKSDLRVYMDSMDKAVVIYEFTNNEKHTNESHAEINDKIEKALEFAIQQLTTLFSETVRDLLENNEKEDAEVLMQIDQFLHKLGILDHFDTYVKLKERDFAKKIKEIIAVSDVEADEAYRKGSHPSINGVTIFINSLKQGRTEVNKIFNSGDANLIFNNLVNSYYKCLIDLTDVLIGPKNSFETNYNFFASLDFVEKFVANSEVLQTILGTTYSAIEDILDRFNTAFKLFIKGYSKIIMEENKRPDNEQISHITYKAITLVTQLQDYHKVLSYLSIESDISGAIIKSVIKLLEENRTFFKPKNPLLPLFYILNNLFYMISKTKNEDTEAIIDFSTKDIMDDLFEKHILEYLALLWKGSNEIFSSNVEIAHEKNGKLKSSTRKAIKKKFAEFNHLVQDFQKSHKDVWFINKEFTETLARKNKKHVLAKYQNFYNTYGELNFTKNRDKYVKFNLSQLSELIDDTLKYSYGSSGKH